MSFFKSPLPPSYIGHAHKNPKISELLQSLGSGVLSVDIEFKDDEGSTGTTGKGEQLPIIRQAFQGIATAIQGMPDVPIITFSGQGESRVKIYDRWARKIGGSDGYVRFGSKYDMYFVILNPYYQGSTE